MTNLDLLLPTHRRMLITARRFLCVLASVLVIALWLIVLLGFTSDESVGAYDQGAAEIGSHA